MYKLEAVIAPKLQNIWDFKYKNGILVGEVDLKFFAETSPPHLIRCPPSDTVMSLKRKIVVGLQNLQKKQGFN